MNCQMFDLNHDYDNDYEELLSEFEDEAEYP